MKTKILAASLAGLMISFWASSSIYEVMVVPRLANVNEVSNFWWVATMSPILIVAISTGYFLRKISDLVIISILGASAYLGYDYWKAMTQHSGNLVEGGAVFFLLHITIDSILLFCVVFLGWLLARGTRKKPAN